MSDLEILEKLKNIFDVIIHTDVQIDNKNPNELYLKELGVNSIGLVYFAIAIEETFNIDMSNVTFNTFETVQNVIDYIKGKL